MRFCNLLPCAYSKLPWVNLLWHGALTGVSPEVTSIPCLCVLVRLREDHHKGRVLFDKNHSKAQIFEFQ